MRLRVLPAALLLPLCTVIAAPAGADAAKRNGRLAYVTAIYPDSGDSQVEDYRLYVSVPGQRARFIAHGQDPAFSPAGRMLAFTRGVENGIGIARGDGTGRRTLTSSSDSVPVWSPSGREIAFIRYQSFTRNRPSGHRVFVIRPDGKATRRLGKTAEGGSIAWSPAGRQIAFDGEDGSIFIAGSQGLRRVAASASGVQWTSRGQLSYTRDGTLIVLDAQGVEHTLATGLAIGSDIEDDRPYDWSPDGRRVVFSRIAGIFVINADGTNAREVASGGARPRWAPDGRTVFYERPYRGVYGVAARGGKPRLLARPRRTCDEDCSNLIYGGDWQPLLR